MNAFLRRFMVWALAICVIAGASPVMAAPSDAGLSLHAAAGQFPQPIAPAPLALDDTITATAEDDSVRRLIDLVDGDDIFTPADASREVWSFAPIAYRNGAAPAFVAAPFLSRHKTGPPAV